MLKIQKINNTCVGCGACYNVCPVQCINMKSNSEGFLYPIVNEDKCTGCNICEKSCPVIMKSSQTNGQKHAYFGWSKNNGIRKSSSSGGAFAVLSNIILSRKGIVYGAHFDVENMKLINTHTDKVSLDSLQKSKYVESNTGVSFSEIREHLINQRQVLYCGNPCVVAGLNSYLGDINKELLLCVDFVCHGVPPISLLREHIALAERRYNSKLKHLDFRPKTYGWSKQSLKMQFENGLEKNVIHQLGDYSGLKIGRLLTI